MNEEFKLCPFCSEKNILIWNTDTPWVQCYNCLASMEYRNTQEQDIKYWNRRVNNGKAD